MRIPGGSPGYGSQVTILTGTDVDEIIVPAGTRCVFDGLVYPGGTQDNAKLKVTMRTVGFAPLLSQNVNGFSQANMRKGTTDNTDASSVGRAGIESNDGLRIIKEAGTLGCIVGVLYRIGMP